MYHYIYIIFMYLYIYIYVPYLNIQFHVKKIKSYGIYVQIYMIPYLLVLTCRCGSDSLAPSPSDKIWVSPPQDGNGLTQEEVDAGLQVEELPSNKNEEGGRTDYTPNLIFSHLKIDGWNTTGSFWNGIFSGAVFVFGRVATC